MLITNVSYDMPRCKSVVIETLAHDSSHWLLSGAENMQPLLFVRNQSGRILKLAGLVIAAATLTACSSLPPPVEQMAVTRTTVERVSSAPNAVDAAPVELSQARDKLTRAERAMNDKDYVSARRLGAEAEADARVAESRASAMRGERALKEVRDSIRSLQDEINRRAP
jgi:predicted S18 family serine protease